MRTIDLDATLWSTVDDFYRALLSAIGAPEWHGHNLNALVDSMIWGGINAVEPPYEVKIFGTSNLPEETRTEIELAERALAGARDEFLMRNRREVDVYFSIAPSVR